MAIYWPTPGFKGRTFKLCVLTRWDFNICIRSSPLRDSRNRNTRFYQIQLFNVHRVTLLWACKILAKNHHPSPAFVVWNTSVFWRHFRTNLVRSTCTQFAVSMDVCIAVGEVTCVLRRLREVGTLRRNLCLKVMHIWLCFITDRSTGVDSEEWNVALSSFCRHFQTIWNSRGSAERSQGRWFVNQLTDLWYLTSSQLWKSFKGKTMVIRWQAKVRFTLHVTMFHEDFFYFILFSQQCYIYIKWAQLTLYQQITLL